MDPMWDRDAVTRDEVVRLLKEQGLPDERIDHSAKVADLALRISDLLIIDGLKVQKAVVEKGALLHDIGYLQCTGEPVQIPGWKAYGIRIPSDDINHPVTGAIIAKSWGFSDEVADCVLRHNIGAFTVEDCTLLRIKPLPEKDCAPVTREEKIVHYADHLMLLKKLKLDPLKDQAAPAKACLPWLRHYFKERANMKIEIDNPIAQREVGLNNELKKYLRNLSY